MRRSRLIRSAAVALIPALLASPAGADDCIQGSGVEKTEERALPAFSKLDISGHFRVEITSQRSQRFELRGDDNIVPHITTSVVDRHLKVGADEGICPKTDLVLRIDVETLESLRANGAQEITVTAVKSPEFHLSVSGVEGATLSGETGLFEAELAGAGSLDAKALQAETVDVAISGSGEADVYASKKLSAKIMGMGEIRYYGDPADVDKQILGLGSVTAN